MSLILGIIIIFGLIFLLGQFTGFLGESLMVFLMVVFVVILAFITLGYAFL